MVCENEIKCTCLPPKQLVGLRLADAQYKLQFSGHQASHPVPPVIVQECVCASLCFCNLKVGQPAILLQGYTERGWQDVYCPDLKQKERLKRSKMMVYCQALGGEAYNVQHTWIFCLLLIEIVFRYTQNRLHEFYVLYTCKHHYYYC